MDPVKMRIFDGVPYFLPRPPRPPPRPPLPPRSSRPPGGLLPRALSLIAVILR